MSDPLGGTAVVLGSGFAVQRLVEIFDPALSRLWPGANAKRVGTAVVASLLGIGLTLGGQFTLVFPSYPALANGAGAWFVNLLVTGLAIGAGTEGINTVLKYAQYSKDAKKGDAPVGAGPVPQPPPTAVSARAKV